MPSPAELDRMVLSHRVEAFIHHELSLIDDWRLDDWRELLTDDAVYTIPSTDRQGDTTTELGLVDDDRTRLHWRVERLKSARAHREYPWSRVRHYATNFLLVEATDEEIVAQVNVILYRYRYEQTDPFLGSIRYHLVDLPGEGLRIKARHAQIDQQRLAPNGAVSVIF